MHDYIDAAREHLVGLEAALEQGWRELEDLEMSLLAAEEAQDQLED